MSSILFRNRDYNPSYQYRLQAGELATMVLGMYEFENSRLVAVNGIVFGSS